MPSPTLRRRRLARDLYELRMGTGMSAKTVANLAKERSGRTRGWSESKLNRVEMGEWARLRVDDVMLLLDIYGVTDPARRSAYADLVVASNQKGWWAPYTDILGNGQYIGLETDARRIRSLETQVVPGLLQTEDYARALIRGNGLVSDAAELDRRVEARMIRKAVLERANFEIWALIDETALLRITRGLRGQLVYLLEASNRDNVGIQVLPLSAGPHPAMNGSVAILEFDQPDPPVAYVEAMAEEIYLEGADEVARYQRIYDYVGGEALSFDASRDLIRARLDIL